MHLTTTRTIEAPIDTVWAQQIDHERWPEHLPNFRRIVRHDRGAPFAIGSSAAVTQPLLGTVDWKVTEFAEQPSRRAYAWTGAARGATYVGRHEVESVPGGTRLTLTVEVDGGGLTSLMAPLMKRSIQKSLEQEAAAFEQWALAG